MKKLIVPILVLGVMFLVGWSALHDANLFGEFCEYKGYDYEVNTIFGLTCVKVMEDGEYNRSGEISKWFVRNESNWRDHNDKE